MIRLRSRVRDERPSCRSSLASERRASGRSRRAARNDRVRSAIPVPPRARRSSAPEFETVAQAAFGIGRAGVAEDPGAGAAALETRSMNCAVSSIQPESSTAPACRNISQGARACRAPAASAAARVPSKGRKRQPATSATRSITPVPARSTSSTSRDHAGRSARHQRRQRGDGGLFDAFGGNNDAEHRRIFDASNGKTPHCYHLVTFKSAL